MFKNCAFIWQDFTKLFYKASWMYYYHCVILELNNILIFRLLYILVASLHLRDELYCKAISWGLAAGHVRLKASILSRLADSKFGHILVTCLQRGSISAFTAGGTALMVIFVGRCLGADLGFVEKELIKGTNF